MQPAAWLPQKSSKAEVENIVDNTALLVQQKANIQKKIVTSSDTAVTKRVAIEVPLFESISGHITAFNCKFNCYGVLLIETMELPLSLLRAY